MVQIQQLALDLGFGHNLHTFDTFIVGENAEMVCILKKLSNKYLSKLPSRMVYIWGQTECGKTHLLHSINAKTKERNENTVYLTYKNKIVDFNFLNKPCVYCIDDIHLMNEDQHIAVFNLINQIRNDPKSAIITSGNLAPKNLSLREDVRTRMGWGLVYQVKELNNNNKKLAIINNAKARGINLDLEIADWLLNHTYTDMNSLIDVLNALDIYSLQQKKMVSITKERN